MNIIKKVIVFIKNIFTKQKEIKKIEEPKNIVNEHKRENFIEKLKINTILKRKVETLTCSGNGLGIQKKMRY